MTASTATRLLSAGALGAALAGCSGAAQLAPAGGLGAQSVARKPATQSARQPAAGDLFASAGAVAFASRQLRLPGESTGFESTGPKASTGDSILFISASMSGSVYAYDLREQQQIWGCSHCGGYGLATDPLDGNVAVATYEDYSTPIVQVYTVNTQHVGLTGTFTINNNDAQYALGLAFDAKGNLYASVTPSNQIVEFYASTIASRTGNPDRTYTLPDLAQADYIATDGDKVVVDGVSKNNDFIAVELTRKGDKVLNDYGSLTQKTGVPGGIAIDAKHNLTVNNQYGTLATYAAPWTGKPTATLNWNPAQNDYTGIALDPTQTALYASDFSSEYDGIGIGNTYPLKSVTGLVTYPMAEIFLGITVTRSN